MAGSLSGKRTRLAFLAALTALALALAVWATGRSGDGSSAQQDASGDPNDLSVALASFDTCDALLDYYRTNAARLVGPYGLSGGNPYPILAAEAARDSVGGATTPAPAQASGSAAVAGSNGAGTGTNVQVAGVDEADLAKVVGGRLFSVTDGVFRVTDLRTAGRPTVVGSLTLESWYGDQMLVTGNTVLLVGSTGGPLMAADMPVPAPQADDAARIMPVGPWVTTSRLVEIDVSVPAKPRVRAAVDVDGSLVGVRMVDGVARIAVSSSAGRLPFVYPANDTEEARERALATNKDLVARSTLDQWLPRFLERDVSASGAIGAQGDVRRLVACGDVSAPRDFSGLDTLTVMSLDLAEGGMAQWDSGAVVASGSTLYATAEHTYIATSPWSGWLAADTRGGFVPAASPDTTQIHLFASKDGAPPTYQASGQVRGTLIGQYAMDEYEGALRVASTTQPMVGAVGGPEGLQSLSPSVSPSAQSVSQVSVLVRDGDRLVVRGSVGGLGKTEQIRGVRFLGDVGYVVTFRQTDPLYTIDLSNPARPTVAGELKILGYSSYLHPAGPGLLLGIGQDATAQGRTTGLHLSLFDVSNPAVPRRIDAVGLGEAWSTAEGDPHAFTFVDGLALAPYESWTQVGIETPVPQAPSSDEAKDEAEDEAEAGAGSSGSPGIVSPRQRFDAGVIAVRVGSDGMSEAVYLRPVANGPVEIDPSQDVVKAGGLNTSPLRTFVTEGVIYTLTATGVAAHDATTLRRIGFTRF